jgi:L-ascorbate metabolism protein UlaG (beta-lactamase superfamily)
MRRHVTRLLAVTLVSCLGCSRHPDARDAPIDARTPSPTATVASSAPAAATGSAGPAAKRSGRPSDTVPSSAGDIRITPLNHGSILFELGGRGTVYVDPTKDALSDDLPKADAIFVTDVHHDHLDPAAIDRIRTDETVIVAPPAVVAELPKTLGHVYPIANGARTTEKAAPVPKLGFAFGFGAVPMYNLVRGPSAGKLYHDKGRGNGYVLEWGDKRIYVSGDTECTPEMKKLERIDVAFVCMNLPYTMPPTEAAECIKAFRPAVVYPYHYRGSNLDELTKTLEGQPIEVRLRNWY